MDALPAPGSVRAARQSAPPGILPVDNSWNSVAVEASTLTAKLLAGSSPGGLDADHLALGIESAPEEHCRPLGNNASAARRWN